MVMAGSKILAFFIAFALFVNLCDAVPALYDFQHDSDNDCKDDRPDCDYIIELTGDQEKLDEYCIKWKNDPAVKMCQKTCGMCKAPSPVVAECKDDRPDCIHIVQFFGGDEEALEKYCRRWQKHAAIKNCRKTCNLCSKAPSPTGEPQTEEPGNEEPSTKPVTQKTTAAPKPTKETGGEPTGFQKVCLEAHNYYRFVHGVPPLKWSEKLSRDAQSWANHLAITNKFDHDPMARGKDQGENLYYRTPPKRLCEQNEHDEDCMDCWDIVKLWYDEEKDYDYVTGKAKSRNAVVLHFTQLVWKASTELGMATAVANNRLIGVARYSPVGNNFGEFKENVPPPA